MPSTTTTTNNDSSYNNNNNEQAPPKLTIKSRFARMFLNFLDEHGDYRTQLEEAAARAAAASAFDLLNKDKKNRKKLKKKKKKKKKRRFRLGGDTDEEEEDEYEEDYDYDDDEDEDSIAAPPLVVDEATETLAKKFAQLPEDPYEQIQFYFHTFTTRTRSQFRETMRTHRLHVQNWMHDELHHEVHVPLASLGILTCATLLWGWRRRQKRLRGLARTHGILGKKFSIGEYVHPSLVRGRICHQFTERGMLEIEKLRIKAEKAESAALASMRPYQRKAYERWKRLEEWGEWVVTGWLVVGIVASACALGISMGNLVNVRNGSAISSHHGDLGGNGVTSFFGWYSGNGTIITTTTTTTDNNNDDNQQQQQQQPPLQDGHIYSLDGPIDSDGYPIGMRELAEENYASCLLDAELRGVEDADLGMECDVSSFFEEAVKGYQERSAEMDEAAKKRLLLENGNAHGNDIDGDVKIEDGNNATTTAATMEEEFSSPPPPPPPSSPLRTKIKSILTNLGIPSLVSNYLTTLHTQTLAYLSSLFSLLLFLLSHYLSHKLHLATMTNDPMKHFVATATDSTIKADGTVQAKRGESEAQRKKRERMLQAERLKAQMAQLAMEAKQRVEERRMRLEGAEAVKKEEEEKEQKVKEESEEVVKNHGRQFMMVKAGVPEEAILQSFSIEGFDEEEARETLEKLKEVKARRTEERRKEEEKEEEKKKKEEDAEKEKEKIAAERLRMMKKNGGGGSKGGGGSAASKGPSLPQCHVAPQRSWSSQKPKDASSIGSSTIATLPSVKSLSTTGGASATKGKLLGDINSLRRTPATAPSPATSMSGGNDNDMRYPSPTSTITASTAVTASSKKEDPSIAKGRMLGDIGKMKLGGRSLRKTTSSVGSVSSDNKSIKSNNSSTAFKRSNSTPVAESDRKTRLDVTPQHSNVKKATTIAKSSTSAMKSGMKKLSYKENTEEEKKGEEREPQTTPLLNRKQAATRKAMKTPGEESEDSVSSPSVPAVTRISSPDESNIVSLDMTDMQHTPMSFDTPSAWDRRPSARVIQATIEAVEQTPEQPPIHLGPGAYHSPAFSLAIQNSNASWDRRPSSRDIMAKIKAAEESEDKTSAIEEEKAAKRAAALRGRMHRDPSLRNRKNEGDETSDALAIIEEHRKIEPATSFEVKVQHTKLIRSKSSGLERGEDESDGSISEISMTTYEDQSLDNSYLTRRSIPKNLFLPSESAHAKVPFSPALTASPGAGFLHSGKGTMTPDKVQNLMRMAEKGELNLPTVPKLTGDVAASKVSTINEETNSTTAKSDSASGKTDTKSRGSKGGSSAEPKVETEEEKQKRLKAEARAKKFEEMALKRHATKEDNTTVTSGISRRHRLRRKKSALAKISPDEKEWVPGFNKERIEWKNSIFSHVVNAEQAKWRRCIFSHVILAEETREKNLEAQRVLDEMNEEAQKRKENRDRIDAKAKKFAARARKFHQLRRGESMDDDSSVVSSTSKLRRRRGRKSSMKPVPPILESSTVVEHTVDNDTNKEDAKESREKIEREQWTNQIFSRVIGAECLLWKKNIFNHVINAEEKRKVRLELEESLDLQRAAVEARKEKEKQNELRAKKMERITKERRALAMRDDNIDPDCQSVASTVKGGSSMKKMRDRRKKAALARKANQS